jgi:geranylgeranyl pyrophosphate synthase
MLADWAGRFDAELDRLCPAVDGPDPGTVKLVEAMRYSLLAPGKRIRPFLVCRCARMLGAGEQTAYPAAAALECVHAFSLIHDDLPAMDDDRLRRGRPTNHVVYGEATAILAGDALLTLAFELLASQPVAGGDVQPMIGELARAVGHGGMIGGQAADIAGEGCEPDRGRLEIIHARKTAALFECACRLGAMVADSDKNAVAALGAFGASLGRAFQIADDILDETASARELGKSTGKDTSAGKLTFPRCVGIEESRRVAVDLADRAVAALHRWGAEADDLRALARYAVDRRH